jgi:dTDP-4-amino-4,6-dideoxygalactose transaminase
VYVDVTGDSLLIDPNKLNDLLSTDNDIAAIVVVHLYGLNAQIRLIRDIALYYGIPIIEDACQAGFITDKESGKYIGANSDCLVLSFGHTKILDAGGGGLLLLNNEEDYLKSMQLNTQFLPRNIQNWKNLELKYKEEYYSNNKYNIGEVASKYRNLFIFSPEKSTALKLLGALKQINFEITDRIENWMIYYNGLHNNKGIHICGTPKNPSLWRFTFIVNESIRGELLTGLRAGGHHASSWYPCVPDLYINNKVDTCALEVAREYQKRVINLWLKDIDNIYEIIAYIKNFLYIRGENE